MRLLTLRLGEGKSVSTRSECEGRYAALDAPPNNASGSMYV